MTDETKHAASNAAAIRDRKAANRRAGQKAANAGRRRGFERFKEENPGTGNLLINPLGIVFITKPAGYEPFVIGLVKMWLINSASTAETNVATIAKIQAQFPEHNFTERAAYDDLPKKILDKIKALLAEHDVTLHKAVKTLAQIKKALRTSGAGHASVTRVQINGTLSSAHFGPFKVEDHKGRNCIRITSDGKRRRIYLDNLIALSDALAKAPGIPCLPIGH